jgi:hypothetical protein
MELIILLELEGRSRLGFWFVDEIRIDWQQEELLVFVNCRFSWNSFLG